jgi:hypothetical protein
MVALAIIIVKTLSALMMMMAPLGNALFKGFTLLQLLYCKTQWAGQFFVSRQAVVESYYMHDAKKFLLCDKLKYVLKTTCCRTSCKKICIMELLIIIRSAILVNIYSLFKKVSFCFFVYLYQHNLALKCFKGW